MILLYKGVLSSETLDTTNHPLYNEFIFRSSLIILNEEGFLTKEAIYKYVKEQYGTEPEFLWKRDPNSAVLRHRNRKWYAVFMCVEGKYLGLPGNGKVDIMNVKCDPEMVSLLTQTYGLLPGYHMNKKHWISVLLDDSVGEARILDFLDMSYDLIDNEKMKKR